MYKAFSKWKIPACLKLYTITTFVHGISCGARNKRLVYIYIYKLLSKAGSCASSRVCTSAGDFAFKARRLKIYLTERGLAHARGNQRFHSGMSRLLYARRIRWLEEKIEKFLAHLMTRAHSASPPVRATIIMYKGCRIRDRARVWFDLFAHNVYVVEQKKGGEIQRWPVYIQLN